MRRTILIALPFAFLSLPAAAETLAQAVSRAVQYFPETAAARARQDLFAAQAGQARGDLLPSIHVSLGEGRERSRNVSTLPSGRDPTLTRREADLSVSQLLFDGGAARGQASRFDAHAAGAAFTVLDTLESVAQRAGFAFVEVRRLREQRTVAQDNVKAHERTLNDVGALADAGRGRRADVVQAQARKALADSALEQLDGLLAQAEAAYKYMTGRFPDQLDPSPAIAPAAPSRLDELVDSALRAHPAIRAGEKDLDAARHDRQSARATMTSPRVTLEAGASHNRNLDGLIGPNQDRYATLRLRYALFRGFADEERVREAEARIDEAHANLQRVRLEVERDVRQAWDALASDRRRLPQLAEYARASADVAEAYRLQFQLGQRSLLDVLNGENERFNAVGGYIAGSAAVARDELRLLASTGRLLETLGIAVPLPQAQAER